MESTEAGLLYIVGTPIGNLNDFSGRAVETLKNVDFIAAEDTRVSVKLLSRFNIKKPMISCHEHNINQRSREIIGRLLAGEHCALITDAGMPCISDPGEELVRLAGESGIKIETVPGPSALITALAVSGLSTSRFSFEGFLSVTKKQRTKHLEEIKTYPNTLIFYEAPHKLKNTLDDLLLVLGDREIALCRELTKLHEEIVRGRLSDIAELYKEKTPRGEYVLVISGYCKSSEEENTYSMEQATALAAELVENGMKQSEACKIIAEKTGLKKSEIYKGMLG